MSRLMFKFANRAPMALTLRSLRGLSKTLVRWSGFRLAYAKRWIIKPSFRDSKDLCFAMAMSAFRIDDSQRRDRLLLLNAFAILLLTL
jgi:hypothetical protein